MPLLLLLLFCVAIPARAFPVVLSESIQMVASSKEDLVVFTGERCDTMVSGVITTNAFHLPAESRLFSVEGRLLVTRGSEVSEIAIGSRTLNPVVSHTVPIVPVDAYESLCIVREAAAESRLLLFDLNAGTRSWQSSKFNNPKITIGRRNVFVIERGEEKCDLVNLDVRTGRPLWRAANISSVIGDLTGDVLEADNRVIVTDKGRIRVLSSETGQVLRSFTKQNASAWRLLESEAEVFCIKIEFAVDPLVGRGSNSSVFKFVNDELEKVADLDVKSFQTVAGLPGGKGLFSSRNTTEVCDLLSGKSLFRWPGTLKARFGETIFTFEEGQAGYSVRACNLKIGGTKVLYRFEMFR